MTHEDLAEARKLLDLCNVFEGLDLPLDLDLGAEGEGDRPHRFLSYEGEKLTGMLTLQHDRDVEACLAVHPAHRRRGVGGRLLAAAVDACRGRGLAELLLVCEDASRSGRAFVASTGATYRNAEYRLRLVGAPDQGNAPPSRVRRTEPGAELQPAHPDDVDLLASIIATSFGHAVEAERQRISVDLTRPTHRFFIARAGDQPVGSLGVTTAGDRVHIVAMGVLPESRNQGHGRRMLQATLAILRAEGQDEIFIEVDADNLAAISLYRSCGFRETARYDFFRLPISRRNAAPG